MPGVELKTSVSDGHVVVALHGELDVTGAADVEAAATALVMPGRFLIIDISALDFIDCGALRALLRVQELAWSAGGDVALAAPHPNARRLLALTGMNEVFWVFCSARSAVAGMSGRGARYADRRLAVSTARPGRAASSLTGTGLSRPLLPWRVPGTAGSSGDGSPGRGAVGAGGGACRGAG